MTWVCTSDAMRANLCGQDDLGKFIVDLPSGKSINETSIWNASVGFKNLTTPGDGETSSGFWNPPGGNPALPGESSDPGPTNWRRQLGEPTFSYRSDPIHYRVPKTGFYCVGKQMVACL